jgi:phosphate:Na+ symporter
MSTIDIIESVFKFIGGIGIFMFSMKLLSEGLESVAGNKLKRMFGKISKNKLAGVGIGTVSTALVQSSGAVTVMVIGFLNAGIMDLTQAASIIFGSNIGTTITPQIVALGLISGDKMINISAVLGAVAGFGAIAMRFPISDKAKRACNLLVSIGMLFIGLLWMSSAMNAFAEDPRLTQFLATDALKNPLLLLLVGILLTVVVQSSTAITSITITMIASGLLTVNQGVYLVFGSNIGTCAIALVASIGSAVNAKRAALIHLLLNVFGVAIFGIVGVGLYYGGGLSLGDVLNMMFPGVPETQLAMMHTLFNVISTIILLPMVRWIIKLAELMIKDKPEPANGKPHFKYLEEHLLGTPSIAVGQLKNETLAMADTAITNFNAAMDALLEKNMGFKTEFFQNEAQLNFLNRNIPDYLVKLTKMELNEGDAAYIGTIYHTVSDLERVGDYAKNIFEYAEELIRDDLCFSDDAMAEIDAMKKSVNDVYRYSLEVYKNDDVGLIAQASEHEERVDDLKESMVKNHIERLNCGTCKVESGALYYALANDCERVADHLYNIAKSVNSFKGKKRALPQPVQAASTAN